MIFKLSKALTTQNGQTYNELNLDLDALTGDDILAIEQSLANESNPLAASIDISRAFFVRVAARASGVNWHELKRLNIKDFTRLMREVSNFLYSSDSEGEAKVPAVKTETDTSAKSPVK